MLIMNTNQIYYCLCIFLERIKKVRINLLVLLVLHVYQTQIKRCQK